MKRQAVVLVAHGTVRSVDEIPEFLLRVRRGRAAPESLVAETRRRYELIGGSPLLKITAEQAEALATRLDMPVRVAMRLWHPLVEEVLPRLRESEVEYLCILPMAPFSVSVYYQAAVAAAQRIGLLDQLELVSVAPWGTEPALISAHANAIRRAGPADATVVTAHSLPLAVLKSGDRYAEEVEECVRAVASALGREVTLAYQSQSGAMADWLGPDLRTVLERLRAEGARRVVLAPLGFLAEHVETLYDLDIEARGWAQQLDLELVRVPALNTDPGLIEALASVARRALDA